MFDDDNEPKFFSERPEWEDVVPLEQYENMAPLAPIMYTPEYKDATNYFRAIAKSGEKSARVLELTEAVIRMNPGHYSAWQYRYETLLATSSSLTTELALMDELAVKYLKSYQVWHHRRLLQTLIRKPVPELAFITRSLAEDSKNYHTWSYRQWLLGYFNDENELWTGELDFVDEILAKDVRNNSAWHHRYFVVWASGVRDGDQDRERVLRRELTFVKQSISLAPNNASAWNYLRGVLQSQKIPFETLAAFVKPYSELFDPSVTDIIDVDNPRPSSTAQLPCAAAIEFLADVYEEQSKEEGERGAEGRLKAIELWKSLANEHDTIRKNYWEYRIREILAANKPKA
ncbi:protein prenylyltransferase [Coprinopsis marcescibilis]|uniref:Protein farnesyltransferase/geranylgeranyltransferase type-1 subunit alpha n=1 Tax=Coprinopsis marcescibilis TaxID=230819 RepID=A0A5C3KZH5_COPMA|nr:protein prenylyltransferase [Coprinopsis marcescibilis]